MPVLKTMNSDGTPYTPSLAAQRAKQGSLRNIEGLNAVENPKANTSNYKPSPIQH